MVAGRRDKGRKRSSYAAHTEQAWLYYLSVTRLVVHRVLPLAPLGACIAVRSEHCVNAAAKEQTSRDSDAVGDARVADPERYLSNGFGRAQQTQRGARSLTSAGRLPYRAGCVNLNRDSSAHVRRRIGATRPMVRWIDLIFCAKIPAWRNSRIVRRSEIIARQS